MTSAAADTEKGMAFFSEDRRYRYALSRVWEPRKPMMLFIGLNPSTADENSLDPTLRRVVGYAKREDCGGIWVANLFAFRATKPRDMMHALDPVGPDNDTWLKDVAKWCAPMILAGWGHYGRHRERETAVKRLLDGYELKTLGLTKFGHPKHPLYLPLDAPLTVYQPSLVPR